MTPPQTTAEAVAGLKTDIADSLLHDLATVDVMAVQCVQFMINAADQGADAATFRDIFDETMVTTLSDGSTIELYPGGRQDSVEVSRFGVCEG